MSTTSYDDSLKSTLIIPASVIEREQEKYHNNNNDNSNLNITNASGLKIEEVSNETSNLMIEDRQHQQQQNSTRLMFYCYYRILFLY